MEISAMPFQFEEKKTASSQIKLWRILLFFEIGSVLFFTLFPLFFNLPYRINLYLTWEGAYRLYLGQVPFKDFGMPLGYGFFMIPTLFFFLFGPATRSLLYAQVFMNLLTYVFYRGILKQLGVSAVNRLLAVLLFTVSYSFIFFWPWYNHTAFLFQLGGIYFCIQAYNQANFKKYFSIIAASVFTFFCFFTKQDYGGMALMFTLVLIAYQSYVCNNIKLGILFIASFVLTAALVIAPFINYNFFYWFNYGQAPHDSRLSAVDFLNEILGGSVWEKFYLFIIFVIAIHYLNNFKKFITNKNTALLFLISIGMILEALIVKVTSRNSLDTTTFYHGFACAFIFTAFHFDNYLKNIYAIGLAAFCIVLWWSGMYWKYANRIFYFADTENKEIKSEGAAIKSEPWQASSLALYKGVTLPEGTNKGIERLKKLPIVQEKKGSIKVLNMSELTGLAYELPFTPAKNVPLWYHLNIGMFDQQVKEISSQVKTHEYDLVLFEVIPSLDNFYPEAVRQNLKKYYHQVDSFVAPRKEGDSHIEVFVVN